MIMVVGNDKIVFSPHFFRLTHIFIYNNNYFKYVCVEILINYLLIWFKDTKKMKKYLLEGDERLFSFSGIYNR